MLAIYRSSSQKNETVKLKTPSKSEREEKKEDENLKSPVLSRRIRNPFVKGADGVSPSLLTRARRRTRLNLFTPTVIDNTAIAQSKFFSSISSTSEETESESKSSESKSITDDSLSEEIKVKGKENLNVNMPSETREDVEKKCCGEDEEKSFNEFQNQTSEEDEISTDTTEQTSSDNILDRTLGLSSVHIYSQLESQEEKSTQNSEKSEESELMDTGELLNDMDTRSSSPGSELEYSVNTSSIHNVRPNLFKWENTKTLRVKKLESSQIFKPVDILILFRNSKYK